MPIGTRRRADFFLNNQPYMLVRGQMKGRAWSRTGQPDTPSRRSSTDAKYGQLPDELDHPEVWDDWSGGFGHAYRRTGENTYHWGENFDARVPRQLVHAQIPHTDFAIQMSAMQVAFLTASETYLAASTYSGGQWYIDPTPLMTNVDEIVDPSLIVRGGPTGMGRVILLSRGGAVLAYPTATTFMLRTIWSRSHPYVASPQYLHPAVSFGSYLYFGTSDGTSFLQHYANGGALICSSPGYRFATPGNRMWRAHGADQDHANYLQNVADPAGAASLTQWAATYNMGNYAAGVKDLLSLNDQVFAGTDIGLYAGDETGTFVNVLGDLSLQTHPDNCRDLTIWENSVIVPHIAGVFRYNPGGFEAQIEDISPPRADRSPLSGRVRAVRGYGRYLYAGLYTGSQSWLLSGERQGARVTWHTLQRLPHTTKISRLHVDGITTASDGTRIPNHFWIATDGSIDTGGTAPVYWWPIPNLDGNPLAPSPGFSANYIGSARMDLGNVDWGAPSTPKFYRAVEVWADLLLSGYRYCDIYYDVDQSGSFTLLGRAQTSPKTTLYFPAGGDTAASYVSGQSIELSLRSFTASPAFAPVYRSIVLRGALRPRSVDEISAVVRIADGMKDRQGGTMRSAATMMQELRDLAVSGTPTTLIDLTGAQSYVTVLPPVSEQEMYQQSEEVPEIAATIRMGVMTFS